jgi:hypothetical protein
MNIFSVVIEIVFVLLAILLVVTIIKYPRQIFISLPAGILRTTGERLIDYIIIFTTPIWIPIWLLDKMFKWGLFKHRFFRLFNLLGSNDREDKELPEVAYDVINQLNIDFSEYSKFYISSEASEIKVKSVLIEALDNIDKSFDSITLFKIDNLTIAKVSGVNVYDFHLLIQCLQTELNKARNYGFARVSEFSFFGIADQATLNNIVGKTSSSDIFSFNLVNGQDTFLAVNNAIAIKTKYSTKFFVKLTDKV